MPLRWALQAHAKLALLSRPRKRRRPLAYCATPLWQRLADAAQLPHESMHVRVEAGVAGKR